jgi:type IV pilus assembly protein PilO
MAIQDTIKGWPWWAQVLIFVGLAAAIFYLGNSYLITPQKQKIADLNGERESLIQEINKGETLKSRYIEFEAELKRLELQLESLKKILPESEEIADLYSKIQQEGTELGLNITNFKPGKHVTKEYYDEWPIAMTMTGNYHILAKFFERLGKLYRIINVNDVTIKSLPTSKVATTNTITANCVATTFIYREESRSSSQSSAKTKGGR